MSREERVEWRVETDQTEDDFGTNERGAREWLARCKNDPDWLPAVLLRRTVVTETSPWARAPEPASVAEFVSGEVDAGADPVSPNHGIGAENPQT